MKPDIGAILREARMAAGVDISDLEQRTKIRAKYLRALENEEWSLLPGATYVKSFLRAYSDALGLDSRKIIEQYRLQYERQQHADPVSLSAPGHRSKRRQHAAQKKRRSFAWLALPLVTIGLICVLFLLGRGDDNRKNVGKQLPVQSTQQTTRAENPDQETKKRAKTSNKKTRVRLVAQQPVYVCLMNVSGKRLVSKTLQAGEQVPLQYGKKFFLTLGNSSVKLYANGQKVLVKPSSEPIGYVVSARGIKSLSATQRPTCTN